MTLWLAFLWMKLYHLETARTWIWVGRLGISFRRIPRFDSKLMIKRGAKSGIRVSQFGPLVVTWPETR